MQVGEYRRVLKASLPRLIENALDWEHLPHLHRTSFTSIDVIAADARGWRAAAVLAGGRAVALDLRLHDDRLGWTTTTRDGEEELSRIVSRAEDFGPGRCAVTVEFFVPGAAESARAAFGAYFEMLYAQLYDEDEAMMIAREAFLLQDAAARRRTRAVTLKDGRTAEIPLACPHWGLPLDAEPGADGVITCPWHGYRFDAATGKCVHGRCKGWESPGAT